ncbi:MAG: hypothetical protein H5U02_00065 [Clostridia bacterium]|nr:hypothetical protein [Clostridia bacterium]
MSMIEGPLRCVSCGNVFAAKDIGITGRCRECWEKALEEHDLLMRTIIWREKGELVPVGRYMSKHGGR